MAQLNECPDFLNALKQVTYLANPEYEDKQWAVLQALFLLLPLLLGHLQVHFSESNEVDFTALSQQALEALGDVDNPTDLALYMDTALHHLLVDEFQDTSQNQFEFITKLVQGWQPDEGKTLFIVGDPMQSIYRFRQAEVGLFFRAKEQGIGPLRLNFLQLQCNFRSTQPLVQWVNQHFANIFPKQSDMQSGAVSFHPSSSMKPSHEHQAVIAQQFKTKRQEADWLIATIQQELKNHPEHSLAILVRSRTHLTEIIHLLRQAEIPYQGNEIDLLANLAHIRDVFSLTQALLSPANRLSWLAMLRSPYCGLALTDLLCIARFNKKQSIYQALMNLDDIQGLSEEGRIRATFFTKIMHAALGIRFQMRLSDWVADTLKKLHLDKILDQKQLDDLEQFWILLDTYEQDGRIPDWKAFTHPFNKLYSQQVTPSRLQVMTIHKSKGLEFDAVFLPGLGSQAKPADKPMLRWLQLTTPEKDNLLLMSAIQAADEDQCALYDYLGRLEAQKALYESQRLLYVAVTRAKSRLYLMDGSAKSSKNSFRHLLKNQEFVMTEAVDDFEENTSHLPQLFKLPLQDYASNSSAPSPKVTSSALSLSSSIPRLTGVLTHRLMQWICDHHPQHLDQIPWPFVLHELNRMGFDKKNQEETLSTLKSQVSLLFQDPRGLWIMQPHEQEKNEYELLVEDQGRMVTRIIDRTFEEANRLWLIDFKTGKDDKTALIQHQQQLNQYKHHMSSRTSLAIHCGLYYLSNGHWVEW